MSSRLGTPPGVPPSRWYTIDTGETYSPSPDVLFYDVEASVEEGFPKPENPRVRGKNRLSRDVSPFARYHSPHIEYYLKKKSSGRVFLWKNQELRG